MKQIVFVLLIIVGFAQASELQDKIKDIVGKYEYQTHNKLIRLLFANEAQFYKNSKVHYTKTLYTLKSNGLLKLGITDSRFVDISFDIPKDQL